MGHDYLIPWGCSIHLYPDECRLEIPSRGIDAMLHVTSSNHILVNLADFECMDELDYDVWFSKRGTDSEETGSEELPENREFRERNHLQHIHSIESSVAIRIAEIAACSCKRLIGIGS